MNENLPETTPTPTIAQVMLVFTATLSATLLIVLACNWIETHAPADSPVSITTESRAGNFGNADNFPSAVYTSLPDLRKSFFDNPDSHRIISGTVEHYTLLNVDGEAYVALIFDLDGTKKKGTKDNDAYTVFFSAYADVTPDILILPENDVTPSIPLAIETDGSYFVFPDYDY